MCILAPVMLPLLAPPALTTDASKAKEEKAETSKQPVFVARLVPARGDEPASFEDIGMIVNVTWGEVATVENGKKIKKKRLTKLTSVLNVRFSDTNRTSSTKTVLKRDKSGNWSTGKDGGRILYVFSFHGWLQSKKRLDYFLVGLQSDEYLTTHYSAFSKKKGMLGRFTGTGCSHYPILEGIEDDDNTGVEVVDEIDMMRDL